MLRLFLQIALAVPDSGYATPALRDFVARAAEVNRLAPAALAGYEATAESEVAVFSKRPGTREALPRPFSGARALRASSMRLA